MSEAEVAALKRQLEELWVDTRARHAALHDEIVKLSTSLRCLRRGVRRLERRRKSADSRWHRWMRWGGILLTVLSRGTIVALLLSHPEIGKVLLEFVK